MGISKRRIAHYKKKADWHKANVPIFAKNSSYKCEICLRPTNEKNGVIHHIQYTGFDYEKPIEKLISDNAIKWLCKECHKFEHVAYSKEEVNFRMKHSGYCTMCDRFAWQAWTKMNLDGKPWIPYSNFPLCNGCQKELLRIGILKEYEERQFSNRNERIYWGDLEKLDDNAKAILEFLNKKIEKNQFRDPNIKKRWQNNNDIQGSLF